jgi:hypothetical protein
MRLREPTLIVSQDRHVKNFLGGTVSGWNHPRLRALRVTAQEALLVRGQFGTAQAAAGWNYTPLAGRLRGPLVSVRRDLFTLAQPGSLIKTSNWSRRASKRPIRKPLSTTHQIPFAPPDADGAA